MGWQLDVLRRVDRPSVLSEATEGQNHSLNFSLGYGLTPRWAVEATLPLVYKSQEVVQSGGDVVRSVQGLGDPLLLVKAALVGLDAVNPRALRLGVALGVKVPLGEDATRDAAGVLPQAFQVSSGAWDGIVAGYFGVGTVDKVSARGSAVLRLPTANARGYRFGATGTVSGDLQFLHLFPVVLSAGARGTWALMDTSPEEDVHASGGGQASAHLGVGWNPGGAWFLTADAVLPVIRKLMGNQMTLQQGWTVAVRTEF